MKAIDRFLTLSTCLAALTSAVTSWGATDLVVGTFDDPAEASTWARWWGSAPQTYEHDATMDAAGNPASGSLKATVDFDFAAYGGDNQFAVLHNFVSGPVNGLDYTNLVFDLYWDGNSPKRVAAQDYGWLEIGLRVTDEGSGNQWAQTWLTGMSVQTADQWVHVEIPIDPTLPNLGTVHGIVIKMWSGNPDSAQTGRATFWIDNVQLLAAEGPPPPPTMAIDKAVPGLNLFASAAGQRWQRQSIVTVASSFSWLNSPFDPVTYSITIADFPDAAHSGFQAHIFLVPSPPNGPTDSSVDWNAPDVVFIQIANTADGGAYARFMYKTNQPSGNSMLWNTDPANGPVGTLAIIGDSTPIGTWSVTFQGYADITITTPSMNTTNFMMPSEAMDKFVDPLYVYFGIQPNDPNNIGQSAIFSRVQIEGVVMPVQIDETFQASPLDPLTWQLAAADAPGVVVVPPNAVYWVSWTTPAVGFTLEASPDLSPGSWADPGFTSFQVGARKMSLITQELLPPPPNGFFRLVKP